MLSFVRSITLKGERLSPSFDVLKSVIVAAAFVVSESAESELVLSLPIELSSSLRASLCALSCMDFPPVIGLVGAVAAVILPWKYDMSSEWNLDTLGL